MKTARKKERKERKTYTLEQRSNARRYYFMGLTIPEIGKLIEASPRTVEKWQIAEKWNDYRKLPPIKERALQMQKKGYSYSQIAEALSISRVTVYRWLKQAKQAQNED